MRLATLLAIALTTPACADVINLGPERRSSGGATASSTGAGSGSGGGGGGGGGPLGCGDGVVEWVKQLGDKAPQTSSSVSPDGSGGIYISLQFSGQVDLGDGLS